MNVASRTDPSSGDEQRESYKVRLLILDLYTIDLPCIPTQNTWQESYEFFRQGIELFETVRDKINAAFLACNMGKLMRVGYIAAILTSKLSGATSKEVRCHMYS